MFSKFQVIFGIFYRLNSYDCCTCTCVHMWGLLIFKLLKYFDWSYYFVVYDDKYPMIISFVLYLVNPLNLNGVFMFA